MSKTLKTYPDGSEMTTTTVACMVLAGLVMAPVITYGVVKWDNFKERRIMKKYNMTPR